MRRVVASLTRSGTLGRLGSARIIGLCGAPVWVSAEADSDGASVDLRCASRSPRGLMEPCVAGPTSSSHCMADGAQGRMGIGEPH